MAKQIGKRVVVIRHGKREDFGTKYQTWEVPAMLTAAGIEMTQQFVRDNRELLEGCTTFACSPLRRTQQTLHVAMTELGLGLEVMDFIILSNNLWTNRPRMYVVPGKMLTMREFYVERPGFAHKEGVRILEQGICALLDGMNDSETALAVTHGGPIDFLLAEAKLRLGDEKAYSAIEDLGGCQGMILTFGEQDELVKVDELRWKPAPATKS